MIKPVIGLLLILAFIAAGVSAMSSYDQPNMDLTQPMGGMGGMGGKGAVQPTAAPYPSFASNR